MAKITPIVLCGGSGTRLWPLSRKAFPKQFVPLVEGRSLLHLTLERLHAFSPEIICLSHKDHRFLVQEAMEAAGVKGTQILEPEGRNTAPAMAMAALNSAPDDLLLFCPSDHYIPDVSAFFHLIQQGIPVALQDYLVTFGIVPTAPKTAYGYIQQSAEISSTHAFKVAQFIEKPSRERAESFLLTGGYSWNAGIFLVKSSTLLTALALHAPDILSACQEAISGKTQDGSFIRLKEEPFLACRRESIDYAVLEKHEKVAVIPFAGLWSDVGSWEAVAELTPADSFGNRINGHGFSYHSAHTFIHAPHRPVVALGTENLLIVDTPDALLVVDKNHTERVKQVVESLEDHNIPQAQEHRQVARPWGTYDSIDKGERFQVKRITVKPGGRLSLQVHRHRAEHWIVVQGKARVTRGTEVFTLTENQSTYIPAGTVHRLENLWDTPLEMIEVQSGNYLGEDDIERLDDTYGRSLVKETMKKKTS